MFNPDSPGYNAKYCTYTLMEEISGMIVASKVVCYGEDVIKSTNAMEVEGLDRCLDELVDHNVLVAGVATDRHPMVTKYMRTQRPTMEHQYEIFHTAKSVTKQLTCLANTCHTDVLCKWIQSISNHLWWCCAACDEDKMVSMHHHITSIPKCTMLIIVPLIYLGYES